MDPQGTKAAGKELRQNFKWVERWKGRGKVRRVGQLAQEGTSAGDRNTPAVHSASLWRREPEGEIPFSPDSRLRKAIFWFLDCLVFFLFFPNIHMQRAPYPTQSTNRHTCRVDTPQNRPGERSPKTDPSKAALEPAGGW